MGLINQHLIVGVAMDGGVRAGLDSKPFERSQRDAQAVRGATAQ